MCAVRQFYEYSNNTIGVVMNGVDEAYWPVRMTALSRLSPHWVPRAATILTNDRKPVISSNRRLAEWDDL